MRRARHKPLSVAVKMVASRGEAAYPDNSIHSGRAADGKFAPLGVSKPWRSFSWPTLPVSKVRRT